jgi:hypothetical protein
MDETYNRSYESKSPESHIRIADPLCAIGEGSEQKNPRKYPEISADLARQDNRF